MRLSKIQIQDFKKIQSVEMNLSDVNILVGINGCGKSSIIQGIHLACCVIRQAHRIDSGKTNTVSIDELDYLPTNEYQMLGHGANWGNKQGSPSSQVTLTFQKNIGEFVDAKCELRSARNAGISISGTVHADLAVLLRDKKKFFSAYIPGISGVPNSEDKKSKKVVLKACSFGDSNVILRNALLLLKEDNPENITMIENWIEGIIGPIKIFVDHNNDNDLHITCKIKIDGTSIPLELLGTGYLQLIQIFCYVLLFNPGVLLIDEPDIHLHPTIQERLVSVLADVAKSRGTRVLITTHSPFIVRGAPPETNVCWLENGNVASQNRTQIELALGWGAFGKKILILSEDSNTDLLRKILSQWPELERLVAFYPGNGFKSLLTPQQAHELTLALGSKFKIMVHRDRDSMTDEETQRIITQYEAQGSYLWCPTESDIESYFCSSAFLEIFLSCTQEQALSYLAGVFTQQIPIRQQFDSQRVAHNRELYPNGGSPTNEVVWNNFQNRPLKGAKGKFVFDQLKNQIPDNAFRKENILNLVLNGQIALDLKHKIERVIAS